MGITIFFIDEINSWEGKTYFNAIITRDIRFTQLLENNYFHSKLRQVIRQIKCITNVSDMLQNSAGARTSFWQNLQSKTLRMFLI